MTCASVWLPRMFESLEHKLIINLTSHLSPTLAWPGAICKAPLVAWEGLGYGFWALGSIAF